jgi:gluconate 2-dehydrogenase alpha chain
VLFQRKNFEIRLQCRVLGVDYDREAKRVLGVRNVDLITGEEYEQPADVAAFTMSNTRFLVMPFSGIADAQQRADIVSYLGTLKAD